MAFKAENITLRSKSIFHDDEIFVWNSCDIYIRMFKSIQNDYEANVIIAHFSYIYLYFTQNYDTFQHVFGCWINVLLLVLSDWSISLLLCATWTCITHPLGNGLPFWLVLKQYRMYCMNTDLLRPINGWRHKTMSTLVQVTAYGLTTPRHYLNQCWLIISFILLHSRLHREHSVYWSLKGSDYCDYWTI